MSAALPAAWRVFRTDGNETYADEPSARIPAGTYLVGRTDAEDPESTCVVLRVELAVDPRMVAGVDAEMHAVADALAQVLTDSISAMDPPEPARAER